MPEGAAVKACLLFDLMCEDPVAEGVVDAEGAVDLTLVLGVADQGFMGYLDFVGAPDGEPWLPMLIHFPAPIRRDSSRAAFVLSVQMANMMGGMMGSGGALDPTKGYALVNGLDCGANPARSVVLESSPASEGEPVYGGEGGVPDLTATETQGTGMGYFIQLDPGEEASSLHSFAMRSPDTGDVLGSRQVVVRKGHGSLVFIAPSPAR